MVLGQSIEFRGAVMNVSVHGPGMRGCPRYQSVTIMLRRDAAVMRGALQLRRNSLELLSSFVSWIGHAIPLRLRKSPLCIIHNRRVRLSIAYDRVRHESTLGGLVRVDRIDKVKLAVA